MKAKRHIVFIGLAALLALALAIELRDASASETIVGGGGELNPFQAYVASQTAKLKDHSEKVRAGAAEALGYLRAYEAQGALLAALNDPSSLVRREAAISLAWAGDRAAVKPLAAQLEDDDWVVRQAASVALNNLTGMEFPFDALATEKTWKNQASAWRKWVSEIPHGALPDDVSELVESEDLEEQLRGLRAVAALGSAADSNAVESLLRPYLDGDYDSLSDLEKHVAQTAIRALGRLHAPSSEPLLIDLLETTSWARYGADALADFGSQKAVGPMIAAYPKFSRHLDQRMRRPERCPKDDCFSGDNTQDRMFETPYEIAQALVRLPLDASDRAALREIVPYLLANLPSDWDSGMLYQPEPFEHITARLLDEAGLRRAAAAAVFESAARSAEWFAKQAPLAGEGGRTVEERIRRLAMRVQGDVPYAASWIPVVCRDKGDIPRLIELLEHENGWMRINATKALIFMNARQAIEPIAELLARTPPEAEWGFSGVLEHADYNDPSPRWREALIRALGKFQSERHVGLVTSLLEDERAVVDIRYAAAQALDEIGSPRALEALRRAEASHPFQSVRLLAREALFRRGVSLRKQRPPPDTVALESDAPATPPPAEAYVFIKGDKTMRSNFNAQAGVDPWRQTCTVNNPQPTMRVGRNLYLLRVANGEKKVSQLTHFDRGYVADVEVSWDAKKIIFSRRRNNDGRNYETAGGAKPRLRQPGEFELDGPNDPWWHVWEINTDGKALRQITYGPYHDVQPAYLPDGRIVFSRLDVFYSRFKSEVTVQAVFPDGTKNVVLYGPERRARWMDVHRMNAAWTMRSAYGGGTDNRNRVLRLSQPQALEDGRIVTATSGGLAVLGPGGMNERLVPHGAQWAVTSPFPVGRNRVVAAATPKRFNIDGRIIEGGSPEFHKLKKGPELFRAAIDIDHGLYFVDLESGRMELLYNDPETADFEPRPIVARRPPPARPEGVLTRQEGYTAKLFCASVFNSRHERVRNRGKLLRVIEGQPFVSRHQTQGSARPSGSNRWKNHGGTHARVLGTIPLAADGSFYIETPADRLLQVLDSDRKVLDNQTFWMYARSGETRSCIGCHAPADISAAPVRPAASLRVPPVPTLPAGDEFSYRAKTWLKGVLPDESEERQRTVRAVSLMGRY